LTLTAVQRADAAFRMAVVSSLRELGGAMPLFVAPLRRRKRAKENTMPRGDKSAYTPKQRRKARHIEESYEERGISEKEAEARAWATVNKQSGGGEKSGAGRKKSAGSKAAARRDSALRAVATKHGHSPNRGKAAARKRSKNVRPRSAS